MSRLITFPRIEDERGNLSVVERLPFAIRRVYFLYGVHAGASRGGHAHRKLERILIATSGYFVATVDGERIPLYNPWEGLYVGPMHWLELDQFSGGAVCLVLASAEYDENDYIRDYDEFRRCSSDGRAPAL